MPTLEPPTEGVATPPAPYYQDDLVTLYHGDCLVVLRDLPDNSVDSVCCDPPYGLEFMGKEWDGADGFRRSLNPNDAGRDNAFGRTSRTSPEYRTDSAFQEWCEAWSRECLRVLKPGGHMLAFGGSRTWHRLASAVEDAGFEIRDSIAWLYGSGFPKSLNLVNESGERTGWGTALKPAFEPIVVARKPLTGTVAANVLAHGTGALNIDGCRIGMSDADKAAINAKHAGMDADAYERRAGTSLNLSVNPMALKPAAAHDAGRWPANAILDESQASALDAMSGESVSNVRTPTGRDTRGIQNTESQAVTRFHDTIERGVSDAGGASRFFYVAKADQSERVKVNGVAHPTVKPLDLMRWLVRLVTPPGGTVLEPFAGSGTTVEACLLEGFKCIAIEREADYLPLIRQRIARRRDPVAAVKGAGEDGGLFDLLGEESA